MYIYNILKIFIQYSIFMARITKVIRCGTEYDLWAQWARFLDIELVWWWGWCGCYPGTDQWNFGNDYSWWWWWWMVSYRMYPITKNSYSVTIWAVWWMATCIDGCANPWCNWWDTCFWELIAHWWWGARNSRATWWWQNWNIKYRIEWYPGSTQSWNKIWAWWGGAWWPWVWYNWWPGRQSFIDGCFYWAWAAWNCDYGRTEWTDWCWRWNCWSWWRSAPVKVGKWWVALIRYAADWSYWIKCATWWTVTTVTCCWTQYKIHKFSWNWTFCIVC